MYRVSPCQKRKSASPVRNVLITTSSKQHFHTRYHWQYRQCCSCIRLQLAWQYTTHCCLLYRRYAVMCGRQEHTAGGADLHGGII